MPKVRGPYQIETELGRSNVVATPKFWEISMRYFFTALFVMSSMVVVSASAAEATGERQAEVRQRGAEVMPFALADTLHVFEKTTDGGVQRVLARPGHADQVAPIRAHLQTIAQQFETRDFSGPAHIHGDDMPGLAELRSAAKGELGVVYRELDEGAEVTYTGTNETTKAAIHRWFDAQLSDHGHDASAHAHHHAH
jgi:hypothetical protein